MILFKQYVETTVPIHAFTGNSNTLINSQPSSERFWSLFFSCAICLCISKWRLYIL